MPEPSPTDPGLRLSLTRVARFYDQRKKGDGGPLGFRRSSDLLTLLTCLERLLAEGILKPAETRFLDLGCADGRVNVFLSYLVRWSVGVELDEWTLAECGPLKSELERRLRAEGLLCPPDNIRLFHGDSMDETVHRRIERETGFGLEDFDLFYTYLVMHQEFADLLARCARPGAVFMVYGLSGILPRYPGFRLLPDFSPLEGILAVYRKP